MHACVLFIFVCICAMCVHAHVHMCVSHRLMSNVILHHLRPHFLRHCLSINPKPTNWIDWLSSEPGEPSTPSPTTLDLSVYVHNHKKLLTRMLRIRTHVLTLTRQASNQLSYLQSPLFFSHRCEGPMGKQQKHKEICRLFSGHGALAKCLSLFLPV